jgi:site-specific DNA recombinase
MRVAIYARFSSDRQSICSLEDQIRLCRALALQKGWDVVSTYQDAATSGTLRDRRGYLELVTDSLAGKFEVVVAESLDRLNRDLEETARLFKRLKFANVSIVTVSEGPISEIHVSISGLMGEMYLKSLAEKTRRGIEGRVLAGKSGGGRSFGYGGGLSAGVGDRFIIAAEAETVREIFKRFAEGQGRRAIAKELNQRGVSGPGGRLWGDTTIRGHAKKGTGVLNNDLYCGRQVWGRQHYLKDPLTGRRIARIAPPGTASIANVPHLRIVDDGLWEAVKTRQTLVSRPTSDPLVTSSLNDLHRPKFLLSGLLSCGVCSGGYTITAKDRYGCARRGRQGTCSNSHGIQRQDLERRVLHGLRAFLLTPELVAEFISEYQSEWNRLQSVARAAGGQRDRKLADVKRKIAAIITAIEQGIITPTTKERLLALEAEQANLLRVVPAQSMSAIHPNLAQLYRDKVVRLEEELANPEIAVEAKSLLRSMIRTITITPGARRGEVSLELHGELGSVLAVAQGKKNKDGIPDSRIQVSVVAGAGFEPTTFRL